MGQPLSIDGGRVGSARSSRGAVRRHSTLVEHVAALETRRFGRGLHPSALPATSPHAVHVFEINRELAVGLSPNDRRFRGRRTVKLFAIDARPTAISVSTSLDANHSTSQFDLTVRAECSVHDALTYVRLGCPDPRGLIELEVRRVSVDIARTLDRWRASECEQAIRAALASWATAQPERLSESGIRLAVVDIHVDLDRRTKADLQHPPA